MTTDQADPVTAVPSLRQNMHWLASALLQPLGEAADAGLALRFGRNVTATIAPGRHGRLVAMFSIGAAEQMPATVWISALSEAAGWGLAGENQRFVVVDGQFVLLWTTPALPEQELVGQLHELVATAVALAEMTASPAGGALN